MQTQLTRRTQVAAYLFFAVSTLALAGCGNQTNAPATPAQLQMGKQQEQQAAFSRTEAGGQKPAIVAPKAPAAGQSAEAGESQSTSYGTPATH